MMSALSGPTSLRYSDSNGPTLRANVGPERQRGSHVVHRSCEARALAALGRAERARGDLAVARNHWAQALAIFIQLGDTNGAAATRAELDLSETIKFVAQA